MKWWNNLFKKEIDNRIRIEMLNPYTPLKEMVEMNDHKLTVETVYKIMNAIDNNLERVEVAVITCKGKEYYSIGYSAGIYLKTMEECFDKLIAYEEYDLLIELNNYIKSLKSSINIFV